MTEFKEVLGDITICNETHEVDYCQPRGRGNHQNGNVVNFDSLDSPVLKVRSGLDFPFLLCNSSCSLVFRDLAYHYRN